MRQKSDNKQTKAKPGTKVTAKKKKDEPDLSSDYGEEIIDSNINQYYSTPPKAQPVATAQTPTKGLRRNPSPSKKVTDGVKTAITNRQFLPDPQLEELTASGVARALTPPTTARPRQPAQIQSSSPTLGSGGHRSASTLPSNQQLLAPFGADGTRGHSASRELQSQSPAPGSHFDPPHSQNNSRHGSFGPSFSSSNGVASFQNPSQPGFVPVLRKPDILGQSVTDVLGQSMNQSNPGSFNPGSNFQNPSQHQANPGSFNPGSNFQQSSQQSSNQGSFNPGSNFQPSSQQSSNRGSFDPGSNLQNPSQQSSNQGLFNAGSNPGSNFQKSAQQSSNQGYFNPGSNFQNPSQHQANPGSFNPGSNFQHSSQQSSNQGSFNPGSNFQNSSQQSSNRIQNPSDQQLVDGRFISPRPCDRTAFMPTPTTIEVYEDPVGASGPLPPGPSPQTVSGNSALCNTVWKLWTLDDDDDDDDDLLDMADADDENKENSVKKGRLSNAAQEAIVQGVHKMERIVADLSKKWSCALSYIWRQLQGNSNSGPTHWNQFQKILRASEAERARWIDDWIPGSTLTLSMLSDAYTNFWNCFGEEDGEEYLDLRSRKAALDASQTKQEHHRTWKNGFKTLKRIAERLEITVGMNVLLMAIGDTVEEDHSLSDYHISPRLEPMVTDFFCLPPKVFLTCMKGSLYNTVGKELFLESLREFLAALDSKKEDSTSSLAAADVGSSASTGHDKAMEVEIRNILIAMADKHGLNWPLNQVPWSEWIRRNLDDGWQIKNWPYMVPTPGTKKKGVDTKRGGFASALSKAEKTRMQMQLKDKLYPVTFVKVKPESIPDLKAGKIPYIIFAPPPPESDDLRAPPVPAARSKLSAARSDDRGEAGSKLKVKKPVARKIRGSSRSKELGILDDIEEHLENEDFEPVTSEDDGIEGSFSPMKLRTRKVKEEQVSEGDDPSLGVRSSTKRGAEEISSPTAPPVKRLRQGDNSPPLSSECRSAGAAVASQQLLASQDEHQPEQPIPNSNAVSNQQAFALTSSPRQLLPISNPQQSFSSSNQQQQYLSNQPQQFSSNRQQFSLNQQQQHPSNQQFSSNQQQQQFPSNTPQQFQQHHQSQQFPQQFQQNQAPQFQQFSTNNQQQFQQPSTNQLPFSNGQPQFSMQQFPGSSMNQPLSNQFQGLSSNQNQFQGPSSNQNQFQGPSSNQNQFQGPSSNQNQYQGSSNQGYQLYQGLNQPSANQQQLAGYNGFQQPNQFSAPPAASTNRDDPAGSIAAPSSRC
ncbi:hypothetical protein C8J56DRAFT_1042125 [Mycena floridula]|nr:hypothetical protein C8J56DRAFT_1042125 [Mycena floridula]